MAKLIVVCFLGLLFACIPSLTFAQKAKSPVVTKVNSPKAKHADRNEDGLVTKKEALIEKKKDDYFVNKDWEKKADLNQDGVVDQKERSQWKDKHNQDWKKKADLNNDGTVDEKEMVLFKQKQMDINDDGAVDEKEKVLWKREHQQSSEGQE